MDSIKYQQIKNQQVTDSVRNLIMGHVWIFFRTIIQTQTSKTTQKWVTGHKTKLLLWPFQSSDLNPVENEWGELKRRSTVMELWIWRIWRDSGRRNGLWSLVRCSQTSSGIIGENLELLNWQMEVSKSIKKKGAINSGQCVLEKNIYFIMIFPPILNLYSPMKG